MTKICEELVSKIRSLPDVEKLMLVDAILADLDKPDPEMDRIWAEESRKRWVAYKAGHVTTISYEEVMKKYHRS
ncbi:MAG: addiction module protein [Candidatus Ozemobacteraceae bacterium]